MIFHALTLSPSPEEDVKTVGASEVVRVLDFESKGRLSFETHRR